MSDLMQDLVELEGAVKADLAAAARSVKAISGRKRPAMESMIASIVEPNGVYSPRMIAKMLGCPEVTIRKAISRRQLMASRVACKAHRVMGSWIIEWMRLDAEKRQNKGAA